MSLSTSNPSPNTASLDIIIDKTNLNYISKFELSLNVAQHINFYLIFNNI